MGKDVAIAVSDASGLDAPGDPRFGRARRLSCCATGAGSDAEAIGNPNVEAAHGAGTGAAALMARSGVRDVIAGEFGPKAYQALAAAKITMWVAPPGRTARELLALLAEGGLREMQMQVFR